MADEWGAGAYERIAVWLEPAAEDAVAAIAPQAGERVLDVCCGSGNAAALIAASGAVTTGIDLSPRLVEVAAARVPFASFAIADATALPFPDDSFDAAVSVFGVIFAPPEQAAAELLRVVRPGGRVVLTAWTAGSTVINAGGILSRALAEVQPPDEEPDWSDWGDPAVLERLFAPAAVATRNRTLPFTAPSPEAFADTLFDHQPMWVNAREVVGPERYEELRRESADFYARANEADTGFRVTVEYLEAEVRP